MGPSPQDIDNIKIILEAFSRLPKQGKRACIIMMMEVEQLPGDVEIHVVSEEEMANLISSRKEGCH